MPRRAAKQKRLTARTADRHELYQLAVQAPEADVRFISRYFEQTRGEPLRVLREDFCGTALVACHFVQLHRQNRAIGVDLHGPTLAWGRIHNVRRLLDPGQQARLQLIQGDVATVRRPRAQAIAALNFSYSAFKTRAELRAWLRNCRTALAPGGMLFLDAWGGPDVMEPKTDRTRNHGFDYLWEQRAFDPISHRIECAIHFQFRDGSRWRNAFVYDWRLWTLPELQELLTEAGFVDVHVLWEGTDRATNTGNGVYRRKQVGDADKAWIVYVVGRLPEPRNHGPTRRHSRGQHRRRT